METINKENKKRCQEAITAFVDKIRQNAAKKKNDDDALRTAVEEALGVFILFPSRDKGTNGRLEKAKALLAHEGNADEAEVSE